MRTAPTAVPTARCISTRSLAEEEILDFRDCVVQETGLCFAVPRPFLTLSLAANTPTGIPDTKGVITSAFLLIE